MSMSYAHARIKGDCELVHRLSPKAVAAERLAALGFLEQLIGGAAVGRWRLHMRFDPRDLALQRLDALVELVDRQGAEILLDRAGSAGRCGRLEKKSSSSMRGIVDPSVAPVNKSAGDKARRAIIPDVMRAIEIAAPGGPEQLRWSRGRCRSPARAKCWSRSPPPGSTGPTSCSAWAFTRRRPAPATFPGWRSPATVVAAGRGRGAA